MKIDKTKLNRFLMEITKNSTDLKELIEENRLHSDSVEIKAANILKENFCL